VKLTIRREIRFDLSKETSLSLLALAVLVALLLRDAVFRGEAFYVRDLHLQWYGQMESLVRCFIAGSWPVWDPFVSFGQPLLANANNQILYPLTWFNFLMHPWTYYTLFFAFHLWLAGAGMFALCRRLGMGAAPALGAGALWIACGPILSLGNVWNHLAGAAWMPWVALAADRAIETGRVRAALLWGATMAAQILAGSPDFLAMTGLLVLPLAATAGTGSRARIVARVFIMTLIAGVFALLLSAGQLLPSAEIARASDRWNMALQERTYWSIHPALLLQVLVPIFWGDVPLNATWRAAVFESREPFLMSLYLGPVVLALMLAAFTSRYRGRFVLLGGAIAFTLFAVGRFGPFYTLLTTIVPPLRIIRFPSKAMVAASFCACVLAGMGLDAWRRGDVDGRWREVVATPLAVLAVALAAVAWVARFDADTWGPLFLWAPPGASYVPALATAVTMLVAAAVAAALLALLALGRARGRAHSVSLVFTVLAIAQLAWVHRKVNPTAPRELFLYRPPAVEAVHQEDYRRLFVYDYSMTADRSMRLLKRDSAYRVPWNSSSLPKLWLGALGIRNYLLPPIGAAWGLFDSFGRDALSIQPTPLAEMNAFFVYTEGTPLFVRVLQLGAVSQVLALHEEGLGALEPQATLPAPFQEPLRVFRVPAPLPRAYVVDGARVSARGFDVLEDPGFDLRREVVLAAGTARAPGADFVGQARILGLKPDRVTIETTASSAAYAVLVDAWDPGWRATVDGRATPVLVANAAFRAVAVPSGTHVVEMCYRPTSVVVGLFVSAGAVLVGLAFALVSREVS
jgi:hypothetical protein